MRFLLLCSFAVSAYIHGFGQFTRSDSLRGTLNRNRSWWDVQHYDLKLRVNLEKRTVSGSNLIRYKVLNPAAVMQIDLQKPMQLDSVVHHSAKCKFSQLGNAWNIQLPLSADLKEDSVLIYFSGKPRPARFAPWDGGVIWGKDERQRPWVTVCCQGLGASVWWPNKDHQSDEPEKGMLISVTIPDSLRNISNGLLKRVQKHGDGQCTWTYEIKNPINNYDVTMNIGHYVCEAEDYAGLGGTLRTEYCVLDYNQSRIEDYLVPDVKKMLKCFEYWFGPYPFYEDGYRLVETSYLGMEHQSAVAYGNKFRRGYLGRDRSSTGIGLLWDFIIVHESGHEWFGNNITSKDIADMWIHEGFTTYSEALFIECQYNRDSAEKYIAGLRSNVNNNRPVIGKYGVNHEGSSDMYDKGANLVHYIRQIIDNDSLFRELLLGLNRDFAKQTVTTQQVEEYIIRKTGKDLRKLFDQYLRTTNIPVLECMMLDNELSYKWTNCVANYNAPVNLLIGKESKRIFPSTRPQLLTLPDKNVKLAVDRNFYVQLKLL